MIRLVELESLVRPHMGGDHATQLSAHTVINFAGRHLTRLRRWNWRMSPEVGLAFKSGVGHLELPADFGEMVSIRSAINGGPIQQAAMETVVEQRRTGARHSMATLAAVVHSGARPRLELWPAPTSDANPGVWLTYLRDWIDVSENVTQIEVPAFIEPLVADICVHYAKGMVEDRLDERLARFEASSLLARAVEADGMQQSDYGQVQGGAAAHERRTSDLVFQGTSR